MAVGLWLALCGLAHAGGIALARADAGALLVVVAWGCLGTRFGLPIDASRRHAIAHVGVGAMLLFTYQAALAFA